MQSYWLLKQVVRILTIGPTGYVLCVSVYAYDHPVNSAMSGHW
jgi:hypothetical protein